MTRAATLAIRACLAELQRPLLPGQNSLAAAVLTQAAQALERMPPVEQRRDMEVEQAVVLRELLDAATHPEPHKGRVAVVLPPEWRERAQAVSRADPKRHPRVRQRTPRPAAKASDPT